MTRPTTKERYEYLAKQIEREDSLINTRTSWLLTFEGFLFAAFGIISKDPSKLQGKFLWLIPAAGISVAVLAFLGISAAISALNTLKTEWTATEFDGYIQPFGGDSTHKPAVIYSQGIPVILIVTWVIIGFYLL